MNDVFACDLRSLIRKVQTDLRTQLTTWRTLLAAAALFALTALFPAGASAEATYTYTIEIQPGHLHVGVTRLNSAQQTTIRVTRGGAMVDRDDVFDGGTSQTFHPSSFQPGDVVEVFQMAPGPFPPEPPIIAPTESFLVTPMTLDAAPGNPVVSGTAPDSANLRVRHFGYCEYPGDSVAPTRVPGAYTTTLSAPLVAGQSVAVDDYQPDGDTVDLEIRLPGETPCIQVDSSAVGSSPSSLVPFGVGVDGLNDDTIPTVRTVLRRGGTIIADQNDQSLDLTRDLQPLAGDVVEVYRPKDAVAPAATFSVPAVHGVFDPGNDLFAVDAAAASKISAIACRAKDCAGFAQRSARNPAAGRTVFSFGQSINGERAFDLQADDEGRVSWISPDERNQVEFDASVGDLTPPIGSLKVARKLNVSKLKNIKLKVTSNEAGQAVIKLTVTPKLPKAKRGSSAKKAKSVTVATATKTVVAGTTTVTLKLTKAGKKLIKKMLLLKKRGAKVKPQAATLSLSLTDAAGNQSTAAGKTKLIAGTTKKKRK